MNPTFHTLDEKIRSESSALLQERLYDALDLMTQAKQAHWNVRGPSFFSLHQLFDKVHEASVDWVDLLAERIMQLGGAAEGTLRMAAARTRLSEYSATADDEGSGHAEALARSLAAFGDSTRVAIDDSGAWGDALTADIFTEISRSVDQYLWMVEAHFQRGETAKSRKHAAA